MELTSSFVPLGSPLLITLHKPFKTLSSNTIGSLTKRLMTQYGILPGVWGADSTRGAGVLLYKKFELTSEEVCEIGKWRNLQSFSAHYLRLGAPIVANQKISALVHKTSPGICAEPDLSRTPLKKPF